MDVCPPLPDVEDVPTVVDRGHLWLLERVDGYPLRFTVEDGGWLEFGTPDGEFGESTPPQYRPAVRHVRESIDRTILDEVPNDTDFFGVATSYRRIAYEWDRTPPFLGGDVRSGGDFLAPDASERAFRRLGLSPINAFEKEAAARHFALSSYEIPASNWYDGPPLGVLIRNKGGGRAWLATSGFDPEPPAPPAADPVEIAAQLTTRDRIEAVIGDLDANAPAPDFAAIRDRVVERVAREQWGTIESANRPIDPDAVVDAVETATRDYLVAERPALLSPE